MSDIPTYIFIRSNSSDSAAASPTMTMPTKNYQKSSSVSHQDLDAMKRMILEISHDPGLLRKKCSIRQLRTLSMSTAYTPSAASDAAAVASCRGEQEGSIEDSEVMQISSRDDGPSPGVSCSTSDVAHINPAISSSKPQLQHNSSTPPLFALPFTNAPYCQECNRSNSKPPQQLQPLQAITPPTRYREDDMLRSLSSSTMGIATTSMLVDGPSMAIARSA